MGIIYIYYTSPEICLYKSYTLDWYVIPWDEMKNIMYGYANERAGLIYTRVDKEFETLQLRMRSDYDRRCNQTTGNWNLQDSFDKKTDIVGWLVGWLVGWTVRSFRDGTSIYCPFAKDVKLEKYTVPTGNRTPGRRKLHILM